MSSRTSGELSKGVAIPVMAFALLFAGLASTAIGNAVASSKKRAKAANDNDNGSEAVTTTSDDVVWESLEIAEAFAAGFYLSGAILLLLVSIRLFVWKRKWVTPQPLVSGNLSGSS